MMNATDHGAISAYKSKSQSAIPNPTTASAYIRNNTVKTLHYSSMQIVSNSNKNTAILNHSIYVFAKEK